MDKDTYRRLFLKKLKASSKQSKLYKDKMISKRVRFIIKKIKPKSMLVYLPLQIEPDLRNILNEYRKKIKILVPFIESVSFKMVQYRLPLQRKRFGVFEPANSFFIQTKVDLIIVPVIGVDGNFKRIGFGKGMYDRFFEKLYHKPVVVFVQIEKCFTKEKICNDLDIQAHYYVTPQKIIFRGNQNDSRASHRDRCRHFRRYSSVFYSK